MTYDRSRSALNPNLELRWFLNLKLDVICSIFTCWRNTNDKCNAPGKRLKSILIILLLGKSNTLCLHTILWSDSAFCYCLFLCWNIEVSPQPLYILLLKACLKGCLFEAFEKRVDKHVEKIKQN